MSALVLPGDGRPPDAHPRHNTAGGRIHSAPGPPLPVRRVVLYKTGVGYFEHLGTVRDRQDVAVRFTSAQLNDVLKSLTTIDLGKGRISGISYNSIAPVEQRLGALRLPVGATTTAFDLLGSLRGARVQVTSGAGVVEGRLLSVERRNQLQRDTPTTVESLIPPDLGELRSLDLTPAVRIRIIDRDLRQEVGRYLDVVGSSREQDVRRMVISSAGTGERQLFVSYISEVPIWKSSWPAPPVVRPADFTAVLRTAAGRSSSACGADGAAGAPGDADDGYGKRVTGQGPGQHRRRPARCEGDAQRSLGNEKCRSERKRRVRLRRAARSVHPHFRAGGIQHAALQHRSDRGRLDNT